ncbi:MAG: DNA-processing protein DprA [Ahrensia sp.]|nr:DNA-processing protein DprA [Ahrensia sp.]
MPKGNDELAPSAGIKLDDAQRIAWLRLIRSDNIGPATFFDAINHFGTAAAALEGLPELARRGTASKPPRIASESEAIAELDHLERINARLVCFGEPDYPPSLRAGDTPPPMLSVAGSREALLMPSVAIVGSRKSSVAGQKLTRILAQDIGIAGYSITSGLAHGIDTAAHEAALEHTTIAVFAGGLNVFYPPQNEALAREIVDQGGALVSEMPLGWKPRAQDFPRRNRIVAGLSLGLVVVEAAKRSGSLISARLANEMGRLVFAVPGSPLDARADGTNQLIKQGATLVTSARDILDALEPVTSRADQSPYSLSEGGPKSYGDDTEPEAGDREKLLDTLSHTPVHIDDVLNETQIAPGALQLLLIQLALEGLVERHWGNRISLA